MLASRGWSCPARQRKRLSSHFSGWMMHCRNLGLRAAYGLFLGLGLGCAHETDVSKSTSNLPVGAMAKEDNLPKRTPQASTCVAMGNMRAQAGLDPKCPPAEREQALDQGRRAYQQALSIDPKCLAAYSGLGGGDEGIGKLDKQAETYQDGVKVDHAE